MQGDQSVASTETLWTGVVNSPKPSQQTQHIQKAWDGAVAANQKNLILSRAPSDVDKARLLAAASPHSGDWLHAAPITAVGLRLSDEAVRVAVAHRLGSKACEPHTCVCGKAVDAHGLQGLSCRRSAPGQQRHSHLNDIPWKAIKRAQMPMARDVTVPDTYAESHIGSTATKPGAAAHKIEQNKIDKILQIGQHTHLLPICHRDSWYMA